MLSLDPLVDNTDTTLEEVYPDSDAVILVFASGKLLCTGLTDLDEIADRIEAFYTLVSLDR